MELPRRYSVSPQQFVGDDGLPKRDATIVRGNLGVQENGEAVPSQPYYRTLQ